MSPLAAMRRRPLRLLGLLLLAACTGYFLRFAALHFRAIPAIPWTGQALLAIVAALALYCVTVVLGGVMWFALLLGLGERPRPAAALVIFIQSQFAKYLPGNVVHMIGRVALARVYGLRVPMVVTTMVVEMGWNVAAGAMLALLTVAVESSAAREVLPVLPQWKIALAGGVAIVLPLAAVWCLRRLPLWAIRRWPGLEEAGRMSLPVLWGCFPGYVASFCMFGIMADLLAVGVFGAAESQWVRLTGYSAVAILAGLLTPGAPAGLGVREAVFVALLGPVLGPGIALGVSLTFRAVSVASDGLMFALTFLLRPAVRP